MTGLRRDPGAGAGVRRARGAPESSDEAASRPAGRLPAAALFLVLGFTAWRCAENAVSWAAGAVDAPYLDFNVLYLAGLLTRDGRLEQAYSWPAMAALERADSLRDVSFLPFSYPPPFALALSGLTVLPLWAAYAVFGVGGLCLIGIALRRLAAERFWPLALALSPCAYLNAAAGQNGLLSGALAGLSALLMLRGRSTAGGALAGLLLANKPQVAVGLLVLIVLRREVRGFAAAACTGAAVLGLSIAALGGEVVPPFLAGMSETGHALASGRYPVHRMISAFAGLLALGVPATMASALHAATACGAVALVAATARRERDPRAVAGLALMSTAFVSPYLYDYDTAVAGLGLALVLPALGRSGEAWRGVLPMLALGSAGVVGVLQNGEPHPLSLGGPLLLIGFCSTVATLHGMRRGAGRLAGAAA